MFPLLGVAALRESADIAELTKFNKTKHDDEYSTTTSLLNDLSEQDLKLHEEISIVIHKTSQTKKSLLNSSASSLPTTSTTPTKPTETEEVQPLEELELTDDEEDDASLLAAPSSAEEAKQLLKKEKWKALYPTILVLVSSLAFSAMSMLVKIGGATIPSFQLAFVRSIIQLLLGFMVLGYERVPPYGTSRKVIAPLVLRGVLSFCGMSLYFYGVTQLPLGEAVVLSFTNPVFTALFALFILGEKWEKLDILGALLSLTGVVLIARPPFLFPSAATGDTSYDTSHYISVVLVILGAAFGSASTVLTRRMGTTVHALVNVNYFSTASILLAPIGMALTHVVVPNLKETIVMIFLGIFAFAGQYMFNRALQLETAAKCATLGYIQVVYALLGELIIFHHVPDWLSLVGVLLICGWALMTILKRWQAVHLKKHMHFVDAIQLRIKRSKVGRHLISRKTKQGEAIEEEEIEQEINKN